MDGWMDGCMVAWMDERMKEWINATRFKGRIKFHVTYYSAYRYCLGGGFHRASRDCRDCSRDFRRGVRFGRNSYHHHSIPRFPIPGTSCCGRPAILPSRCPFPFTRRLYHYATSSGGTKRAGCGATVPPAVAKVIANPLTPIPDPLCSLAPYKARLTICNWVRHAAHRTRTILVMIQIAVDIQVISRHRFWSRVKRLTKALLAATDNPRGNHQQVSHRTARTDGPSRQRRVPCIRPDLAVACRPATTAGLAGEY